MLLLNACHVLMRLAPACFPSARWDGLEALRSDMAGWLWLPPTAPWAEVAAAAAERHAGLHSRCLAVAVSAFNLDMPGSGPALTTDTAAALPWEQLPPRLQLLLICELHDVLAARFRQRQRGGGHCCEGLTAADLLAGAAKQAAAFLHWLECQKRQGRAIDEQATCAATHVAGEQSQGAGSGARGSAEAERQKRLVRVGLAFQEAMRCHNLVALADLPLLARQLLAAGGGAAAWARQRWSVVLVVRRVGAMLWVESVVPMNTASWQHLAVLASCTKLSGCNPNAGRVPGHRARAGEPTAMPAT